MGVGTHGSRDPRSALLARPLADASGASKAESGAALYREDASRLEAPALAQGGEIPVPQEQDRLPWGATPPAVDMQHVAHEGGMVAAEPFELRQHRQLEGHLRTFHDAGMLEVPIAAVPWVVKEVAKACAKPAAGIPPNIPNAKNPAVPQTTAGEGLFSNSPYAGASPNVLRIVCCIPLNALSVTPSRDWGYRFFPGRRP